MSAARRRRGRWLWLLAVGGLVAIVVVGGRPSDDAPFDPSSTEPSGTKALVLLLEDLGAQVTVTAEVPTDASADVDERVLAVLRDDASLDDAQVEALEQALDDGATVVVSDPFSPLTPPLADPVGVVGPFATDAALAPERCTVAALDGLGEIEALVAHTYEVEGDGGSCYGDGDQAYVVVTRRGAGAVVALGGTTPFTNDLLGEADNAALAARLLVPRPGVEVVLVQDSMASTAAGAPESPFDLVDPSVRQAVVQLGVAFLIYALARGRRLGRPVREPLPVAIEGSELVAAVGDLLHRAGDPARAAALLREDTLRRLRERLGLPPHADAATVATAAAARTGVDPDRATLVLSTMAVTTDEALLTLARDVEALRQEILHEPAR